MRRKGDIRKGHLVATVLEGAWRSSEFPPLEISEADLAEVTPLLYASGAAALAWRRVSNTQLQESSSAEVLHQAYRLQSLQSVIQEEQIEKVFRLLRAASVDAILAKGWAAAGLYPNRDLRPYGDIDICVRTADFRLAQKVLSGPEANDCWVDLHKHFSEIDNRALDDIFARSTGTQLGQEQIRTLGPEDHLALLCIHLLKHGAWRPLWLCDVAAAIECLPTNFDWNICLGSNKKRAGWIVCALGLANELLGADTGSIPLRWRTLQTPPWLVENVIKHWANPFAANQAPMSHPVRMASQLKSPSGLWTGLRARWPDPVLATISVNGSLNSFPRLPYQVANCVSRLVHFVMHSSGDAQEHSDS